MIQSMSKEMFISQGVLFADTVEDAFDRYYATILTGDKINMQGFIELCMRENKGHSFADFYYPVLEQREQDAFIAGLADNEKAVLEKLEKDKKQVYFPLTEENVSFFAEITARNWLFSTFYFAKEKAILWGNYNMEYPLFCQDEKTLEYYITKARQCGLEMK